VKGGKIAALFPESPVNPKALSKVVIDAAGRAVLPGFTDCHMHFMATAALRELALSISEIRDGKLEPSDLEGVRNKIQRYAAEKEEKTPILCSNFVIASMKEDRLPYRQELDQWAPGRIVIVLSMDGHSSSYSTPALKKMGLFHESHNGILAGEDHEFNMGKINRLVEKSLTLRSLVSGVQKTINDASRNGIVCIHCLEGFEDSKKDKALWFISKFGGSFPLSLRLFIQYHDYDKIKPYVKRQSYPRIGGCSSWEMDGSVGSGTAAFYESYANDPNNFGKCYYSREQIEETLRAAETKGYQATAHAIGTKAIDTLLDAYENVIDSNHLRHRIDHFEFPTKEQVDRAIKRQLVITVQPGYTWMDEMFQKSYHKYLRPEQYKRQVPLKTIVEKGGIICGSSDSPVQLPNPFIQIHGMVNFPIVEERLSIYQALRTYTYNGAYATFEEGDRGTLSVGKQADFIIMKEDPFLVEPAHLAELEVEHTFISGKQVKSMEGGVLRFLFRSFVYRKKLI
jgi:predicted amidohydrolase YtcJ